MCGINGFFNFSGQNIPNPTGLIEKMNSKMELRGPDDSGFWSDPSGATHLGHQRLSILDLSQAGHQPMATKNASHTLVFNGEIYNFSELKNSLPKHQFKSNTDTEVLLNLFAIHSVACLNKLRGMFAFAIWDQEKEELFLARDRVGQKPLYYTIQNGIFAFSSQLKSLLELPWINKELDEEALSHFLTYNHLVPPYTMFKGIHKFEPGHYMKVSKTGIEAYKPFWEVSFDKKADFASLPEKELADKVYRDLKQAVEYRMISDVPVGSFLSGGVDSSAIVGLMKEYASSPIKTYSIGFEGQPEYDELKNARKVAKLFGTQHIEKVVKPNDFKELLPTIVELFDEPLADTTSIPIYFLSQLAKENDTKVILTGDGADELFGGYSNWKRYDKLAPYFGMYSQLPSYLKKSISSVFGGYDKASPVYEMLKRSEKGQDFFWSGARGFKESTKHDFLTDGFKHRNKGVDSYSIVSTFKDNFEKIEKNNADYLNWLCYTGLKNTIPNVFLNRLDKLSMAHSIEGRSPFLDHDLIDTAFSISGKWKIKNGEAKYILKKSLERLLPNEVLYRKKQGFCVPIKEWGSNIMVEYLESELNSFCKKIDVFNQAKIESILKDVKNGKTNNTNRLWTIYFLIQWYNKWIDEK
ncbi:MAG: asparagine synthase (glutamine-hydrolyzing) [Salibacteraceae bacterium]